MLNSVLQKSVTEGYSSRVDGVTRNTNHFFRPHTSDEQFLSRIAEFRVNHQNLKLGLAHF